MRLMGQCETATISRVTDAVLKQSAINLQLISMFPDGATFYFYIVKPFIKASSNCTFCSFVPPLISSTISIDIFIIAGII